MSWVTCHPTPRAEKRVACTTTLFRATKADTATPPGHHQGADRRLTPDEGRESGPEKGSQRERIGERIREGIGQGGRSSGSAAAPGSDRAGAPRRGKRRPKSQAAITTSFVNLQDTLTEFCRNNAGGYRARYLKDSILLWIASHNCHEVSCIRALDGDLDK
jgi:hypothetical protein